VGIDHDPAQLARATANRAALPPPLRARVALLRGDAALSWPLPAESVDCLLCDARPRPAPRHLMHTEWAQGGGQQKKTPLAASLQTYRRCDLPWGERFGTPAELGVLYAHALREGAARLRAGGAAVLLTTEELLPALHAALDGAGMRLCAQRPCPLGRSRSTIVVARKAATVGGVADEAGGAAAGAAKEHAAALSGGTRSSRRLEWEGAEGRSEWTALRKAERPPMRPWACGW
jgi:hypothetical protein